MFSFLWFSHLSLMPILPLDFLFYWHVGILYIFLTLIGGGVGWRLSVFSALSAACRSSLARNSLHSHWKSPCGDAGSLTCGARQELLLILLFFFFRFYGLKCLSQSMPPLSLCVAFWCTQVWNFNAVKLILLKACTCYGLALRYTPSTLNHKVICFLLSVRKCFVMFKLELTSVYGVGARYPILFIPNEWPVDSATMCQLYTFSYWF